MEEWIIGQTIDGGRDYALHLHAPRFVVEIATHEDGSVHPISIEFLDGDSEGDVDRHLEGAADAFLEWERRLEEEIEKEEIEPED